MRNESLAAASDHLAQAGFERLADGWSIVTLGDLLSDDRGISVGVMYPGDHSDNGIPLIKAGDLTGSRINPRPEFRISKAKHHEYRRTELQGGEVLMTLVGNVGQCAVVPPSMAGWNTARAVAVIRLNDPSDAHFVGQCLHSRPLQHLIDVWCNTTVQATLNLKEIKQLPLPWPPKSERDAIASFGKAFDDKIELNRRMNEILETMARALFKSWFIDFDPVRAKADGRKPEGMDAATGALFPAHFQDSALGPAPRGWQISSLAELMDIQGGTQPPASEFVSSPKDGYIRLVQIRDYETDLHATYVPDSRKLRKCRRDDVMIARYGASVARICSGLEGAYNVALVKASPKKANVREFLRSYLQTPEFQARLIGMSNRSVQAGFNKGDIASFQLAIPPAGILAHYQTFAWQLRSRILHNKDESLSVTVLRETLLPKLLSGEIRIKDTERFVEASA
jgi:type I restriction enzyme S subunit